MYLLQNWYLNQLKILLICLKYLLGMDPALVIPFSSSVLATAWNIKSLHVVLPEIYLWTYLQTPSLSPHHSMRYLLSVTPCSVKLIEANGEEYSPFFSRLDY